MAPAHSLELAVLTPPEDRPGEIDALVRMVEAGRPWVHVRKPQHRPDDLSVWLERAPPALRSRCILHGPPELAARFGLAGWHERDQGTPPPPPEATPVHPRIHSRAIHSAADLERSLDTCDRLLFAPVFPSLSKPGHGPAGLEERNRVSQILAARPAATRRARVFALGGITPERLSAIAAAGFDGAALLGAIWLSADPRAAFLAFQEHLPHPLFSQP